MMPIKTLCRYLIIPALAIFFLLGCASPTPRYYNLNPMQEQGVSRVSSPTKAVIGIGPIKLADYLNQSQIVTRAGDNQVAKAQFDRWAGPLKNNFIDVLAENIGLLLPTYQIQVFPWRLSEPVDYQVTVDVIRFDGRLGDAANLESRWSVFQGPDKKQIKTGRSSISEPTLGQHYAELVAAQSRAVGQLSSQIAQAIKSDGKK